MQAEAAHDGLAGWVSAYGAALHAADVERYLISLSLSLSLQKSLIGCSHENEYCLLSLKPTEMPRTHHFPHEANQRKAGYPMVSDTEMDHDIFL